MREKGWCIGGVYRGNIVCPRCNSWSFDWGAKYTKSNRLWAVEVYISLDLNSTLDNTWTLNCIIFLQIQVWIPPYFRDAPSNCISTPGNGALLWTPDCVTSYWNSSKCVSLPAFTVAYCFHISRTGYHTWSEFLRKHHFWHKGIKYS